MMGVTLEIAKPSALNGAEAHSHDTGYNLVGISEISPRASLGRNDGGWVIRVVFLCGWGF